MSFSLQMRSVKSVILLLLFFKVVVTMIVYYSIVDRFNLVDWRLYLDDAYTVNGDVSFRTIFVSQLAGALNSWLGELLTFWAFALIGVIGFFIDYLRNRDLLPLACIFLPSAALWTSIPGKEAIFYCCYSSLIFVWYQISVNKFEMYDILSLLVCGTLCLLFRPHYTLGIALFISLTVILLHVPRFKGLLAIIACVIAVYLVTLAWHQLLERGFYGISSVGNTSRFVLFDLEPQTDAGLAKFSTIVPLGVILGFTGFSLQEALSNPLFLLFWLEGLVILFFPFIFIMILIYRDKSFFNDRATQVALFAYLPALIILIVIHSPFGVMNAGTAIRWRVNFELLFYLAPILMLRLARAKEI